MGDIQRMSAGQLNLYIEDEEIWEEKVPMSFSEKTNMQPKYRVDSTVKEEYEGCFFNSKKSQIFGVLDKLLNNHFITVI